MPDQSFDALMAGASDKVTYAGAATTTVGAILQTHGTWIAGLFIGFLGLLMQWYFKRREDRRLQAEHEARMDEMRGHEDQAHL